MRRHSVNCRPRCVLEPRLRRSIKPRCKAPGLCPRRHRPEVQGLSVLPVKSGMGLARRFWFCQDLSRQGLVKIGRLGQCSSR